MGNLKRNLIRNTAFYAVSYFWTLVLGFLFTPILVHYVGLKTYGLYILFGSALGWLWILDLGISSAATRFMSRYAAEGNEDRFADCLSTTLVVKALAGIVIAGSILIAAGPVARWLEAPDAAGAGRVLQLMGLTYVVTNISSAYNAALAARQRMDIPSRLGLALSVPGTAAAVAALALSWGLAGFLAANLAVALVYLVLARQAMGRVAPAAGMSPRRFSGRELRELLSFSRKQAVNRLTDIFLASADRLALGSNLQSVSLYQLGATVGWRIRDVTALTVSASLPVATDLHARGDWAGMDQIFRRGTKYLMLLGLPLMLFAAIFAEEVLMFWMGGDLPSSAAVLRILAGGYFLNVLAAMAASAGAAAIRPGLQARSSLAAVAAGLVAYFSWGRLHGLPGLAMSVSIGYGVLGLATIVSVCVALRGRLSLPLGEVLARPLAATVLATMLVGIPSKWLSITREWAWDRASAAIFVGCAAAAAMAAYAAALRLFKALDGRDWDAIKSVFRKDAPPGPPPDLS